MIEDFIKTVSKSSISIVLIIISLVVGTASMAAQTRTDTIPEILSANDAAKELSNPNSLLATWNFRFQILQFGGTLPDADNQAGSTVLFKPAFPFDLDNGDVILTSTGIPLKFGL